MKQILTILLITSFPFLTNAQQGGVSPQDAIRLDKIWKTFLDGLSRRDTAVLNSISLPTVSCIPCAAAKPDKGHYISFPGFLTEAFTWQDSPLWQAITTKKYWVNTIVTTSKPPNLTSTQKHFIIYELSFVTTGPSVIAPGHEGINHLFQFIDLNGTLKFYGLATVP